MNDRQVRDHSDILDDYELESDRRGRDGGRSTGGTTTVVLDEDVAEVFPDSDAVNKALRDLIDIARRAGGRIGHARR